MTQSGKTIVAVDASPVFGGAQRSFITTVKGLADAGEDILVVSGSTTLTEGLKTKGIPVAPFPFKLWTRSLYGLIHAGSDILQFKGFLSGLRLSDDVTFYANGLQSGLLLTMTLPKTTRLVVHHRDIQCPKTALKKVLKRADVSVVLSNFMADTISERIGKNYADAMECVYNGFDMAALSLQAEEKPVIELPNGRSLVTFVADLVPWKRHDLFIEAMALALKQNPDLFGLVIGGAREKSGNQLMASLNHLVKQRQCEQSLRFVGSVANPLPAMKAANALCVLSDNEPFGRTVIEAAAVGTPLVVRDPGGPVELTTGLPAVTKVDDDPAHIADGILNAVKQDRYSVPDDWSHKFSVDTHCQAMLDILKG